VTGIAVIISHELRGEERCASTSRGTRVCGPIPVVQRKRGIDVPQQLLEPVYNDAVPGDERWAGVNVDTGKVRILVDLFLFVPVRNAIRESLRSVELDNRIDEAISLCVRHEGDVSANSIS
jgi:hypothetical protein